MVVSEETENEWEDRLKDITNKLDKHYSTKKKGKDYDQVSTGYYTLLSTDNFSP